MTDQQSATRATSRPLRIDTALPARGASDAASVACRAEQDGYDALWVSEIDHDPFVQLAVAATATSTVRLGTGIAVAFARSPMTTAGLAHDLQEISGGRFILGLGTQVRAHITRRFSMPWSRPAARMREYILALRAIWSAWETGDRLDFDGEFYTHTLMTPMFTPGPHGFGEPPVVLAAVGDQMTRVAGEVADGMLCHSFQTERYLREHTLIALERGRKASERPAFELVGGPFVATGSTSEQLETAIAATRRQIAFYASTPAYRPVLDAHGWGDLGDRLHELSLGGGWDEMERSIPDDVLTEFAAVGEPEEVADVLWQRYGDVFDRLTLVAPYDLAPDARRRVADRLRALT